MQSHLVEGLNPFGGHVQLVHISSGVRVAMHPSCRKPSRKQNEVSVTNRLFLLQGEVVEVQSAVHEIAHAAMNMQLLQKA